eukprot:s471_g5.t1
MAGDWASLIAEEVEEHAQREGEDKDPEASAVTQEAPKKAERKAGPDLQELREKAAKPLSNPFAGLKPCPAGGYEFRTGHSTKFPKIELQAGETDLQAAFRVASELRDTGRSLFGDGTKFVPAQEAVDARQPKPGSRMVDIFSSAQDAWGQGLLALHRLRNLSARAVTQDDENALILLDAARAAIRERSLPMPGCFGIGSREPQGFVAQGQGRLGLALPWRGARGAEKMAVEWRDGRR